MLNIFDILCIVKGNLLTFFRCALLVQLYTPQLNKSYDESKSTRLQSGE